MVGMNDNMQLGTNGNENSMRIKIHRAVVKGESSVAKSNLETLFGYELIKRFESRMQATSTGSPSNVSIYIICPNDISGTDVR